jgi:hypothetical protein
MKGAKLWQLTLISHLAEVLDGPLGDHLGVLARSLPLWETWIQGRSSLSSSLSVSSGSFVMSLLTNFLSLSVILLSLSLPAGLHTGLGRKVLSWATVLSLPGLLAWTTSLYERVGHNVDRLSVSVPGDPSTEVNGDSAGTWVLAVGPEPCAAL